MGRSRLTTPSSMCCFSFACSWHLYNEFMMYVAGKPVELCFADNILDNILD